MVIDIRYNNQQELDMVEGIILHVMNYGLRCVDIQWPIRPQTRLPLVNDTYGRTRKIETTHSLYIQYCGMLSSYSSPIKLCSNQQRCGTRKSREMIFVHLQVDISQTQLKEKDTFLIFFLSTSIITDKFISFYFYYIYKISIFRCTNNILLISKLMFMDASCGKLLWSGQPLSKFK